MRNILGSALIVALTANPMFAAKVSTSTITITDPVAVGPVTLAPGDYKVSFEGTGPTVQVTLSRHGVTPVVLDAKWIAGPKGNGEVLVGTVNGVRVLREIDLNSGELVFEGSQGN